MQINRKKLYLGQIFLQNATLSTTTLDTHSTILLRLGSLVLDLLFESFKHVVVLGPSSPLCRHAPRVQSRPRRNVKRRPNRPWDHRPSRFFGVHPPGHVNCHVSMISSRRNLSVAKVG